MSMATNIVEYTVNSEHADTLHDRVRAHVVPLARQARGYRGFLLLDRGAGSRLGIVLFDTVEDARLAQESIAPAAMEATGALMQGPIQRAIATAVVSDGLFADAGAR